MEKIDHPTTGKLENVYTAAVRKRSWISDKAFELELSRPDNFSFIPGQRIRFLDRSQERDYSLISTPADYFLSLCIRKVQGGEFSSRLADTEIDTLLEFSGPYGYFTHRKTSRPIVFVATGTGIAPFVSMARSGLKNFTLLHGVRSHKDLYYACLFKKNASAYIPCLSNAGKGSHSTGCFQGRVTEYLTGRLPVRSYDFYLCGRNDMIRDVILIIDDRFPGSFVYTEIYY